MCGRGLSDHVMTTLPRAPICYGGQEIPSSQPMTFAIAYRIRTRAMSELTVWHWIAGDVLSSGEKNTTSG